MLDPGGLRCARPRGWIADAGRAPHGETLGQHRVVVVTAARDRLHRRRVEQSVADVALVDMHPDDLPEYDPAVDRAAFDVLHFDGLQPLAFERAGRLSNARYLH